MQFTNEMYGSNDPQGTRILFVNGDVDPWHALGVLSNIGDKEPALFIRGTAHCRNSKCAMDGISARVA